MQRIPHANRSAWHRLLLGYGASRCGDYLYNVALVIYVLSATHSLGWVAAVSMCRLVPSIVAGPVAGLIADRFDRWVVYAIGNSSAAVIMLGLAWAAAVDAPIQHVAALAFVAVLVTTPARAACTALVPGVVPPSDLVRANTSLGMVENLAIVTGPATGAILTLLGPAWVAFLLNSASFAVAAGVGLSLRRSLPTRGPRARFGTARGLSEGMRALIDPRIWSFLSATLMSSVLVGAQMVLAAPVSMRLLSTGTWGVAALDVAIGVGGVMAAPVLARLPALVNHRRVLSVTVSVHGLAFAGLLVPQPAVVAWLLSAITGAAVLLVDVVVVTGIQQCVDDALLGRVDSLLGSAAVLGLAFGNASAAVLVGTLGVKAALALGVIPAVVTILMRLIPANGNSHIDDHRRDPVPASA